VKPIYLITTYTEDAESFLINEGAVSISDKVYLWDQSPLEEAGPWNTEKPLNNSDATVVSIYVPDKPNAIVGHAHEHNDAIANLLNNLWSYALRHSSQDTT